MSGPNLLQYVSFVVVVALLVKPLGGYMARVFEGRPTFLDLLLRPVERFVYKLTGINPADEMGWKQYALSFILLGLTGTLLLYGILRLQRFLPWFYPAYQSTPVTPDLAANTYYVSCYTSPSQR